MRAQVCSIYLLSHITVLRLDLDDPINDKFKSFDGPYSSRLVRCSIPNWGLLWYATNMFV